MLLNEAKNFIGLVCTIRYRDRGGNEHTMVSKIHDATYVPMYGGYLVTNTEDLRLDRVCEVTLCSEAVAAPVSVSASLADAHQVAA